jgi:hypothetical protein
VTLNQGGEELAINPHLLGKWRKKPQADGEKSSLMVVSPKVWLLACSNFNWTRPRPPPPECAKEKLRHLPEGSAR